MATLSISDIAEAINNNKPMKDLFNTYLRGKASDGPLLTARDIQKLLNSSVSSVFQRLFVAAVCTYVRIEESIRANLNELMFKEYIKELKQIPQEKPHHHYRHDENIPLRHVEADSPKPQLTPTYTYSANYIADLLVQYKSLLPTLIAYLARVLVKFQVMLTTQRSAYIELALQHGIVLSPKHSRHLYDTYNRYEQALDDAARNDILLRFATLQGAALSIDRLHRFFKGAPLMVLIPKHREERDDILKETYKASRDVQICQQAILRPGAPIYYSMNEVLLNNPNFEFVPRPGRNKYDANELSSQAERRIRTPFRRELKLEQY